MNTNDIVFNAVIDGVEVDIDLAPSYVTYLYTSGNFYQNFIEHHNLDIGPVTCCPVCNYDKDVIVLDQTKIIVHAKMWAPFNFGGTYVKCSQCDAVFQHILPPKDLLSFLYTYCYPNSQNKTPRFFNSFGVEEKFFEEDVLDLGGGAGDLRKWSQARYVNADVSSNADIYLNVDERVDEEKIIEKFEGTLFDTIICCDLIEHVLDPSNIFRIAKCLIRPGGKFYLNVGQTHDDTSLGTFHPPHLMSFSERTINYLTNLHSFRVLKKYNNSYVLEKN